MGWPNTWGNMAPWRKRAIRGSLVVASICLFSLPSFNRVSYSPSCLLGPFLSPHAGRTAGAVASLLLPLFLIAAFMLYSTRPKP